MLQEMSSRDRVGVRWLEGHSGLTLLFGLISLHGLTIPFFLKFAKSPARVTSADVLAALLLLVWVVLSRTRWVEIRDAPLFWPTVAFVAVHFISIPFAKDVAVATVESIKIAGIFLVYIAAVHVVGARQSKRILAWALTIGAAMVSVLAIREGLVGELGWGYKQTRAAATMGNPNTLGAYLVAIIPVSIMLLLSLLGSRRLKALKRWTGIFISGAALALMIAAVLLTLSRGAWLSPRGHCC